MKLVKTTRILPIRLNTYSFAIQVADIQAVYRAKTQASDISIIADADSRADGPTLPVLDLRHLFFGSLIESPRSWVIILSIDGQSCALLVEEIQPYQNAEVEFELPPLITNSGCPFNGLVLGAEQALLIEARQLIQLLDQSKPEMIVETRSYA